MDYSSSGYAGWLRVLALFSPVPTNPYGPVADHSLPTYAEHPESCSASRLITLSTAAVD